MSIFMGRYAYGGGLGNAPPRASILPSGSRASTWWRRPRTTASTIILDSDDYYQFMGGLAATVQSFAGRARASRHIDTSRPEAPFRGTLVA